MTSLATAKLTRHFITPEGVDLRLKLGSAGNRAAAFIIDSILMVIVLTIATFVAVLTFASGGGEFVAILWLIGFFVLRNFYFTLFEMGRRGATPGKRMVGLRVIARDGARLTGSAVLARNAMREIEVFLPLSFLAQQASAGTADTFLVLFSLTWSGIFLFFPLFNKDRLRVGDLVAGTWVVETVKARLLDDLVGSTERVQKRRTFTDAQLGLYGIYELQTLERVLRDENPDAIASVAATIRHKAGLAYDGDDYSFLSDYYSALCAKLETNMLVGRRRETKHDAALPIGRH